MNSIMKAISVATLVGGSLFAAVEQAAVKLCVYDDSALMTQSQEWKDIMVSIEQENQKRAKELQKQQEALQADAASFQKQSSMMSQEARERKQMELGRRERELGAQAEGFRQEIGQLQQNAALRFIRKIEQYIGKFATNNGYDVVQPKGMGVYACTRVDQTTNIIDFMNKEYAANKKNSKVG